MKLITDDGKIIYEFNELNNDSDKNLKFVKYFIDHNLILIKLLTSVEHYILHYLCNFISYKNHILKLNNGNIITCKYIANDLNKKQQWIRQILRSLKNKEVLYIYKVGHTNAYIMNPYIYRKGNVVNSDVLNLFKSTIWAKRFYKYTD